MWYDMWYFVLCASFALWIFIDAKKRMNHVVGWPLAILLLGLILYVLDWPLAILFLGLIVLLSIYLAKRNLKEGEVRSGGTGWNTLKYFVALWTIAIAVLAVWSLLEIPDFALQQYDFVIEQSEDTVIEQAVEDTIIGTAVLASLGMLFFIWFGVLVGALVLGLILKDSNIVEKGPTGPLANTE